MLCWKLCRTSSGRLSLGSAVQHLLRPPGSAALAWILGEERHGFDSFAGQRHGRFHLCDDLQRGGAKVTTKWRIINLAWLFGAFICLQASLTGLRHLSKSKQEVIKSRHNPTRWLVPPKISTLTKRPYLSVPDNGEPLALGGSTRPGC